MLRQPTPPPPRPDFGDVRRTARGRRPCTLPVVDLAERVAHLAAQVAAAEGAAGGAGVPLGEGAVMKCTTCLTEMSNYAGGGWCPQCGTATYGTARFVPAQARSHAALREALEELMSIQGVTNDCWCADGVAPCEACAARAALALDSKGQS